MVRFFLQTFGCQMNKNDSERIVGLLNSLNIKETKNINEADIIIINTCSVRQSAEDRVYGYITNWQKLRKSKPNLIIAVTGCMPGHDQNNQIRKKLKGVDLFFGIEELIMFPKWIKELNPDLLLDKFNKLESYLDIRPKNINNFQSFVTIQTGCDNYCTYCIVPYARGRETNRHLKDVLQEVRELVEQGSQEICLLGQVVNNYKISDKNNLSRDNPFINKDDFATLLWEIDKINDIKRVYFTAPDPQYFSDYQIEALKLPSILNYLHLPVQSGDNEILKKMNRKYTAQEYINLVKKIRQAKPNIALGTDIIVGFPGESKEQFQNTLKLYKDCNFDISYPAKYSEREGTTAAKVFKDNILIKEKKKRWQAVQDLMEEIAFKKNRPYLNQEIEVLVEDYSGGICSGRSNEMKFIQFLGNEKLIGKIIKVKVNWIGTWVLKGVLS